MSNNSTYGHQGRFSFGASPATFSSSSQRFEVVSSTVKKMGEILDGEGLLGTRTRKTLRSRAGLNKVGGQLAFDITPRMLDFFLPYILGATESTDTFAVADALSGFDMLHDPFGAGTSAIKYGELYVDKLSLKFGPGILRATMDLIGKTATGSQTFAGAALNSTVGADQPYIFHDCAFDIDGDSSGDEVIEGELVIDNRLDPQFRNNQGATSIRATDRIVSLTTSVPLTTGSLSAFYDDATDPLTSSLSIYNGVVLTTIALNNLEFPSEGPETQGNKEIPLVLHGIARGDSSNPEVSFTVVGASL